MTIVRYEPWNLVQAPWAPSVDVREDADAFKLQADLPGVAAKDIQVTADQGLLTIRGERRFEKQQSEPHFARLERAEGTFLRRFTLPKNVQADAIKARHANGVLEIVIPKQPVPQPHRVDIEVN